jgi:hypothetical protein
VGKTVWIVRTFDADQDKVDRAPFSRDNAAGVGVAFKTAALNPGARVGSAFFQVRLEMLSVCGNDRGRIGKGILFGNDGHGTGGLDIRQSRTKRAFYSGHPRRLRRLCEA